MQRIRLLAADPRIDFRVMPESDFRVNATCAIRTFAIKASRPIGVEYLGGDWGGGVGASKQ